MTADAQDNVAVIHMTNAYGSGLADAFVANMDSASICTQIGYEETATDFSTIVSTVVNDGCTSVMMVSYAADGAMLIEEMSLQGFTGAIYGADGIAEVGLAADMADKSLVDGVIATKPAAAGGMTTVGMVFAAQCLANPDCAEESTLQGRRCLHRGHPPALATLASRQTVIAGTGNGRKEPGGITFLANGDVPALVSVSESSLTMQPQTLSHTTVPELDPVNGIV